MKIEFTQGALAGAEFAVDGPSVVLGRGADVDLQVLDDRVSRRHAQLTVRDGGLVITDLASRNGTYVNGVRIHHAQALLPGDEVTIGDSTFSIRQGRVTSVERHVQDAEPFDWPPPAPTRSRSSGGGLRAIALGAAALILAGGAAFLLLRPRLAATPTSVAMEAPTHAAESSPAPPTTADSSTATMAPASPTARETATATIPAATDTPVSVVVADTATLVALPAVTVTQRPTSTLAPLPPPSPTTPRPTPTPPGFTVSWSQGTYDPWEGGHRLRTDLTITNVSLPELTPPYAPAFVVASPDGSLRSGDLHDYSSPTNVLPALQPGQSVTWTWYTIMPVQDWVVGSAFRYGDLTWTQQFNRDGTLAGPARPTSDSELASLIPTVFPTGMSPDQIATVLPTMLPTIMPSGVPFSG